MHDKHRLETIAFARVPARWNHLIEKNARNMNSLSMILSQRWFPLLAIMP